MVLTCVTLQGQDKSLPNTTIKDLNGSSFNIQDLSSDENPIILTLWATWCKPCKKELNNLHDVYDEWKEETGIEIVAVSIDDTRSHSKVKPYVSTMGWEFKILTDQNSELARALNVSTIPHTFLIIKGKIVYEHRGYIEGDEEGLWEVIQRYSK